MKLNKPHPIAAFTMGIVLMLITSGIDDLVSKSEQEDKYLQYIELCKKTHQAGWNQGYLQGITRKPGDDWEKLYKTDSLTIDKIISKNLH